MSCRSTYGSHGTPLSVFEPEDETPERRGADAEGYLKVALRVRPLIDGRGGRTKLHVNSDRGEVVVEGETDERGRTNTSSKFRFSNTFEDEDNLTIFQTIGRPLVESVMVGFNGTLFAYGQTGSGKTYTIGDITKLGTMHEGVAHRMIRADLSRTRVRPSGREPLGAHRGRTLARVARRQGGRLRRGCHNARGTDGGGMPRSSDSGFEESQDRRDANESHLVALALRVPPLRRGTPAPCEIHPST